MIQKLICNNNAGVELFCIIMLHAAQALHVPTVSLAFHSFCDATKAQERDSVTATAMLHQQQLNKNKDLQIAGITEYRLMNSRTG
jgi:hypothetical protein